MGDLARLFVLGGIWLVYFPVKLLEELLDFLSHGIELCASVVHSVRHVPNFLDISPELGCGLIGILDMNARNTVFEVLLHNLKINVFYFGWIVDAIEAAQKGSSGGVLFEFLKDAHATLDFICGLDRRLDVGLFGDFVVFF